MYFRNSMFDARSSSAYWGLTGDEQVSFTLTHNPKHKNFSASARGKLRTWMRRGYCNSPDGEIGARWRLLMLHMKADYLMEQPTSSIFRIALIDKPGDVKTRLKRPTQLANIVAKFQIYSASKRWDLTPPYRSKSEGPPLALSELANPHVLDTWGRMESSFSAGSLHPSHHTQDEPELLKCIVNELGHPLGSKERIEQAIAAIDREITFKVVAIEEKRKSSRHRSSTLHFTELL